jgi:hypothetical protein
MEKRVYKIWIKDVCYHTIAETLEEALKKGQDYRTSRNVDGSFPLIRSVECIGTLDF